MASRWRDISISNSTLSPSFQVRCRARNLPGTTGLSVRRPLTDRVVLAPAHAGIRTYTAKLSGLDSAKSSCVVFALGYSVVWVSVHFVLCCGHETREGRNRLT